MKVLQRGEGWKLEVTCTGRGNGGGGCGSVLEINEEDIYNTYHYDYAGDKDTYYTISCPICGKETDIDSQYIPYGVCNCVKNNSRPNVLKRYLKSNIFKEFV